MVQMDYHKPFWACWIIFLKYILQYFLENNVWFAWALHVSVAYGYQLRENRAHYMMAMKQHRHREIILTISLQHSR